MDENKPTPKPGTTINITQRGVPSVSGNVGGGAKIVGNNVTFGDDITGRDKIAITAGLDAATLAELSKAFKDIERRIDVLPANPDVDKDELQDTVHKVEEEVKKGEQANPTKVERWLKFLGDIAPDILQVTAATLMNPAMGLSAAIKKIAAKAQSQAAA